MTERQKEDSRQKIAAAAAMQSPITICKNRVIDVCHSSDFGIRRNVRLETEGCMDTKTNYVNVNL